MQHGHIRADSPDSYPWHNFESRESNHVLCNKEGADGEGAKPDNNAISVRRSSFQKRRTGTDSP
jgi:hypothetical protein